MDHSWVSGQEDPSALAKPSSSSVALRRPLVTKADRFAETNPRFLVAKHPKQSRQLEKHRTADGDQDPIKLIVRYPWSVLGIDQRFKDIERFFICFLVQLQLVKHALT